jgi:hypothetical protein
MAAIPVVSDGNTILAAHHDAIATELNGPWSPYTPALTASTTNPTLGSGATTSGRYKVIASGLVIFNARIVFGSSGALAGTGTYSVSLPVAANTSVVTPNSNVALFDNSSSTRNIGVLIIATSTTAQIWAHGGTSGVTNAVPWTWAASDQINYAGVYEPA